MAANYNQIKRHDARGGSIEDVRQQAIANVRRHT
jgi:hypothetical protein